MAIGCGSERTHRLLRNAFSGDDCLNDIVFQTNIFAPIRAATMKRFILLSMLFSIYLMTAAAQKDRIRFSVGIPEKVAAAAISWEGHFGGRNEEPQNIYTLMTQGGFRAPTSKNLKDLIKNWLEKHPKAEAVLVYSMEGGSGASSKIKAVWVTDGPENLNLYLVRNGACPAGTMVLNPGDETPLRKEEYEALESKFWEAQKTAKFEKVGIWAATIPEK